ncbi:hypothetical protein [Sulfitobacter sp.]|uniref:hypothetical protein n=1 Tax=Sulfitobacter sp. TaxID=1903071 RepID=UPI003EF7C47E
MTKHILTMALVVGLSACGSSGGSNFFDNVDTGDGTGGDGVTGDGEVTGGGSTAGGLDEPEGFTSSTDVPPGTTSPASTTTITRFEERGGTNDGDGYVRTVRYTGPDTDTFIVDGLAFDSANVYQRADVGSLAGQYSVYESTTPFPDSVTDDPISQFGYRAIYGVSKNKNSDGEATTQFAIVRTGSYVQYGFGGFLYQRNGTVTLPETGQATFTGKTAGIRDFNDKGGIQYTTGQLTIDIDFEDFNDTAGARGDGVKGVWSNRRVFDASGTDITQTIIDDIDPNLQALPVGVFTVEPGALRNSGDLTGELQTQTVNEDGTVTAVETGNYYAVMSGDDPDEIAGVIVVTGSDTVRETAGFIVYRGAGN